MMMNGTNLAIPPIPDGAVKRTRSGCLLCWQALLSATRDAAQEKEKAMTLQQAHDSSCY